MLNTRFNCEVFVIRGIPVSYEINTRVPKKVGLWYQRGWFAFEKKKKRKNKRNANEMTNDHVMDDHVIVKLLHNI